MHYDAKFLKKDKIDDFLVILLTMFSLAMANVAPATVLSIFYSSNFSQYQLFFSHQQLFLDKTLYHTVCHHSNTWK